MHRLELVAVAVILPALAQGQGYDSALAPYPEIHAKYDAAVDDVLSRLEKAGGATGGFTAAVAWTVESARKLDLDRQNFGPLSLKSCPNWHSPGEAGYWAAGSYSLAVLGASFRMEKPEDSASKADWWQKEGEHLYARAWCDDWPTIWRFHHDALEAGMLGYPEGLGLLLWAFRAGEYLRRADHLEIGEDRALGGGVYKTLVATPSWVRAKLFLENRTHYPYCESTLISWASLRPVVTYFVDTQRDVVVGAEFVYQRVVRDSPGDWHAGAVPGGLVVTCVAEELAQTAGG